MWDVKADPDNEKNDRRTFLSRAVPHVPPVLYKSFKSWMQSLNQKACQKWKADMPLGWWMRLLHTTQSTWLSANSSRQLMLPNVLQLLHLRRNCPRAQRWGCLLASAHPTSAWVQLMQVRKTYTFWLLPSLVALDRWTCQAYWGQCQAEDLDDLEQLLVGWVPQKRTVAKLVLG